MKVVDYIKGKGILLTKEQHKKIQTNWYIVYPLCALSTISLMLFPMLHIWNVLTLTQTQYFGILFGMAIVGALTITVALVYQKNFGNIIELYRLHKKRPEKFEFEMDEMSAETFENELRSIYLGALRTERYFKKLINKIKLYEWDWGTPEPRTQDCGDSVTTIKSE